MPERVLRPRREHHLVDEFRFDERRQGWVINEFGQQIVAEAKTDDRRGVQRVLRVGISRSMRAAIAACSVGGTVTSSASPLNE